MPVALVTGGGIRVGRAIVHALAREGFDVIVHANRSRDAAEAVAGDVRALGRRAWVEIADLALDDGPSSLAARLSSLHPTLDLLVNNAAAYEHKEFGEVSRKDLLRMLDVNLVAPYFLIQGLVSPLRAATSASVVNITDMAVSHAYTRTHFFSHYLVAKAGLEQLTRSLALELGPSIRVNSVAPGPVAMAAETSEVQKSDMLSRIPLQREGSPGDVAAAVVYLAKACYVTGQTIRVNESLSVA